MPGFGSKILGLVVALLGASTGIAQEPPKPMPLPAPTQLPEVPIPDPNAPIPPLSSPNADILTTPGLAPLPGSVADQYATELQAREGFRTYTWRGDSFDGLPTTLLWEPGLAVQRDPRLQFRDTNLPNYKGGTGTFETSIGGTAGLIRYNVAGADLAYQFDMFGVVHTRLSPSDLVAADYRFGLLETWKRGWWSGKIGYEHTSAHLGDVFMKNTGTIPRSWAKDEFVLGLSRIIEGQFRIYGNFGYAFSQHLPDYTVSGVIPTDIDNTPQNRTRVDIGFEWFKRESTGFVGTPFLAGNAEFRGDQNWQPNLRAQAGWMFRNPYQRMGNARFFIEYRTGYSDYGQFYLQKETFTSLGFGFDY